jgi:hypothetical protein
MKKKIKIVIGLTIIILAAIIPITELDNNDCESKKLTLYEEYNSELAKAVYENIDVDLLLSQEIVELVKGNEEKANEYEKKWVKERDERAAHFQKSEELRMEINELDCKGSSFIILLSFFLLILSLVQFNITDSEK